MGPRHETLIDLTRRELFRSTGTGIGAIALAAFLGRDLPAASASNDPLAPRRPHFAPRAKRVIFLHMIGAPSQLDLFDYKPKLVEYDGEPVPEALIEGQRFAFIRGRPKLLGTRFKFSRHGRSGQEISELLPHLAGCADDLAIVKTLRTEEFNHGPAQLFFQTGFGRFGRPSLGAWTTYGLGSENEDLPGFVVMISGAVGGAGNSLWGSGFLPTVYQGIEFRSKGDPVLYLSNPEGIATGDRRRIVDAIQALNRAQLADVADPEIATRISQYEMAYRMQSSVPDLMDISDEPEWLREEYGARPGGAGFANQCLLARRLVERGVRFVQIYDEGWDHHSNLAGRLPAKCRAVDRPAAALIKDLKRRGLLDETLVIWGGEFGRTPMLQGSEGESVGRDHHKEAFCILMAGGGIKGGITHGETDELGYLPVTKSMHVRDLHATILHLLGVDHERLTFKFQGRPFRLTDIGGEVAHELIG